MNEKTPAEILRAAAEVIERNGWYQGDYYDDAQEEEGTPAAECRVCVFGALNIASYGSPECRTDSLGPTDRAVNKALEKALDQIGYGSCADVWNDEPGRTVAEVLDALRRAAQLAEAGGQR